jgi:hypothetical protein
VQRTRRRVGQFLPRPLAPVSAGSSAVKELQQEEEISRWTRAIAYCRPVRSKPRTLTG